MTVLVVVTVNAVAVVLLLLLPVVDVVVAIAGPCCCPDATVKKCNNDHRPQVYPWVDMAPNVMR